MTFGFAALLAWLATAGLGGVLLLMWISRAATSTSRGRPSTGRPPPYIPRSLVVAHVLLAASGLLVWLTYVVLSSDGLARLALAMLVPVALLGSAMFVRWLGSRRARRASRTGPGTPAEARLPVVMVLGHGVMGVATVLLVIVATLRS
jgi:hypothetical protein